MVKKALSILHKEISSVNNAAYFLGALSFISQFLALIRDRLFAAHFGADKVLDLYYAAFRIPDFIFVIVSSLVSVTVLIPLLVEKQSKGKGEAKSFISAIFTAFFSMMTVLSIIMYFLIPYVIPKIFPGFSNDVDLLIKLSRILLLSPFLLGLSNLFASITQSHQRFIVYGLCPVLYNVGIIAGLIFLYPIFGPIGLGFGVVLGAILHASIQIPYLVSEGLMPVFVKIKDFKLIKNVASLSLPRTFSLSLSEITEFVLVALAGGLTVGSISIFSLSWNLQSVPLSIIGVSYSVALFPVLSRMFRDNNMDGFRDRLISAVRQILFLGGLVTATLVVVRAQIVRTVYGAGMFNWDDTKLTAASLALFSISLIPQCVSLVFIRSFYAMRKTKIPVFINTFSAVLTIILAYAFLNLPNHIGFWTGFTTILRVNLISGTSVLALTAAFSIGSIVNMFLLLLFLSPLVPNFGMRFIKSALMHAFTAVLAGFISYILLNLLAPIFPQDTVVGIFSEGLIAGLGGWFIGILFLLSVNNAEANDFIRTVVRLIKREKKKGIVGPDVSL